MRKLYTESMMFSLNGKDYHIAEQGKATLSGTDGPSVSVTDAPDSARASLKSGLLPKSLKIRFSTMPEDELVSVFTLNADFSFSGMKTPRIKREKGADAPDASFLLKMGYIEEAVSVMHSLFRQFAEKRNGALWSNHTRAYSGELLQHLNFPVHLRRIGCLPSFTLPTLPASTSIVRAAPRGQLSLPAGRLLILRRPDQPPVPSVELPSGAVAGTIVWRFGLGPTLTVHLAVASVLIVASGIDARIGILPEVLLVPATLFAIPAGTLFLDMGWLHSPDVYWVGLLLASVRPLQTFSRSRRSRSWGYQAHSPARRFGWPPSPPLNRPHGLPVCPCFQSYDPTCSLRLFAFRSLALRRLHHVHFV